MSKTSVDTLFKALAAEKDTIKKAQIISELHKDKEISLKEIASKVTIHPSYISHYLRILQLPAIVLDGYYAKQISPAHLFILSRLKKETEILKAYKEILTQELNTAQAEELIREIKFDVSTTDKKLGKVKVTDIIEDIVKEFPDVNVKIVQTRIKGKIVLELKGDTEITSEFLKQIADRISTKNYPEMFEDNLQVLE